jgi:hypothetical protein
MRWHTAKNFIKLAKLWALSTNLLKNLAQPKSKLSKNQELESVIFAVFQIDFLKKHAKISDFWYWHQC